MVSGSALAARTALIAAGVHARRACAAGSPGSATMIVTSPHPDSRIALGADRQRGPDKRKARTVFSTALNEYCASCRQRMLTKPATTHPPHGMTRRPLIILMHRCVVRIGAVV